MSHSPASGRQSESERQAQALVGACGYPSPGREGSPEAPGRKIGATTYRLADGEIPQLSAAPVAEYDRLTASPFAGQREDGA
jgi:hypothetical protein